MARLITLAFALLALGCGDEEEAFQGYTKEEMEASCATKNASPDFCHICDPDLSSADLEVCSGQVHYWVVLDDDGWTCRMQTIENTYANRQTYCE